MNLINYHIYSKSGLNKKHLFIIHRVIKLQLARFRIITPSFRAPLVNVIKRDSARARFNIIAILGPLDINLHYPICQDSWVTKIDYIIIMIYLADYLYKFYSRNYHMYHAHNLNSYTF